MPRRYYLRTAASDAAGFTTGVYKSYALDQAINNQPVAAADPVVFYGGTLTPRVLSPARGQFDTGTSLSVDPSGLYAGDDNLRGFLTHFITPPQKEQHLRAGFTKIALKAKHDSALSTAQFEASIYIVDSAGAVVSFLWDKDKAISAALVADETTAGVVIVMKVPTAPGDIPANGRVAVELWVRHTPDAYGDLETVGVEVFLEGSDESFRPTVGGTGAYDVDSVASYVEFPQSLELADEEPVFAVRIDPLQGMKHSRIWSTDVIERDDQSEQRTRMRSKPNSVVEFIGVGHGTDEMELMDALLERLSDRPVWLPWWRDEQTLPSTLAASATSLAVATAGYEFVAGKRAIIWQTPFTWEVVTILSVSDGALAISSGLSREWIAGSASIMPLKDAVMLGALREDRLATDFASVQLAFVVAPEVPQGDIGDCLHPNTTTTAATSGLSPTRAKGDDFSAWGLDDYEAFIEDTLSNPIYENGIRTEYRFPVPNNVPGMFFEVFAKLGENPTFPATWPRNYIPSYPTQVNRNRISQLAVNGGHRTVKAVKTADDPSDLLFGFELDSKYGGDSTVFTSVWARLRYQYSANFPMGAVTDGSEGTYLLQLMRNASGPTRSFDVTIATGTLNNPSSVLTISHKSTPNTGPSLFEVPLGNTADMITTGAPMELVVYAGTAWDEGGTPIPNTYRVAVWFGPAFGVLAKFYDVLKPTTNAFQIDRIVEMRAKNNGPLVPDGDEAICYECISWEYEPGAAGQDPYSVEALPWNPLGESPTSNSFFETRETISGASGTLAITKFELERAQTQVSEPHRFNGSLWYEWTAPSTGTATFDTIGSDALVDTYLGIYTGSAIGSLTEIAVDDDSGGGLSSQVSFAATSGTVYKIQVSYRSNYRGNVTLNWNLV